MDHGKTKTMKPGGPVKGVNKTGYNDRAAQAYRAELRGGPVQSNPSVHSKGATNAARNGFRPSDPRNGSGKEHPRDVASGAMATSAHAPGRRAIEQVGIVTDGSGRWKEPTYPNASKGRQSPEHIHRPGTGSKPSGRMITK